VGGFRDLRTFVCFAKRNLFDTAYRTIIERRRQSLNMLLLVKETETPKGNLENITYIEEDSQNIMKGSSEFCDDILYVLEGRLIPCASSKILKPSIPKCTLSSSLTSFSSSFFLVIVNDGLRWCLFL
jgi:14-3-3 protein